MTVTGMLSCPLTADRSVESEQEGLLRGTLSGLGARQHTAIPLWHPLQYGCFCSQLDDTRGKLIAGYF